MEALKYSYYPSSHNYRIGRNLNLFKGNGIVQTLVLLCFFCHITTNAKAQNTLQSAMDALAQDEVLQQGMFSMTAIDVETGRVLATHAPNKSLIPASSLKVITTATALELLGDDYQFKTELQYDGNIQDGVLEGNIYIKGYGDPTLGSDQMEEAMVLKELLNIWVTAIQQAGIRSIKGQVVGDGSYFEDVMAGKTWTWADLGNYYASGAWGLNIHENLYYLDFQQVASLGERPEVLRTRPKIPDLNLVNQLESAGKNTGDNAYIYGGPYAYTRFVRGTIPVGSGIFTIKGSIPDPPFQAAYELYCALQNAGMRPEAGVTTQLDTQKTAKRVSFHTHRSPTLATIIQRTNFESVNLYCEAMLRVLGEQFGEASSMEAGTEVIQKHWEDKGIDMTGFFLEDGSGLSARNGVTTYQFAQILRSVQNNPSIGETFYESLPVGGQSGTVKYLFRNSKANGKIRLKSGSIGRVRSYSGYATSSAERKIAFSIIANNYTCSSSTIRKKMERVMALLCE